MTEYEPRLTRGADIPKLGVGGNRIMPDGTPGPGPEIPRPQEAPNPAAIDAARRYVQSLSGRRPTAEEMAALNVMTGGDMGILASLFTPSEAGQDPVFQSGIPREAMSADINDELVLAEGKVIDQMIDSRVVDRDTLRSAFEKVARLEGANQADKSRLLSRIALQINDLEAEGNRSNREQMGEQMREHNTGQSKYSEVELIADPHRRNEIFNSFFADADARANEQFEVAFNPYTIGMRYETFLRFIRASASSDNLSPEQRALLRKDYQKYTKEHDVRAILHNANYALYYPSLQFPELAKSMQGFRSELGDYANRISGIKPMMDLIENGLRESMAENGGYLKQEDVIDTIEAEGSFQEAKMVVKIKARFRQMWTNGEVFTRDKDGKSIKTSGEISEWEVDRIYGMARGMEIVSMRLISIAAESKLPKGGIGRFTSLWLQDLLQGYSGYMHLLTKYGISEKGLRPYLNNLEGIDRFLGMFGEWRPQAEKQLWEEFEKNPRIVYDHEVVRYLQRLNPNRCGDIFTWLSWRTDEAIVDKDGNPIFSATQKFITDGMRRMWLREMWKDEHPNQAIPEEFDFNQYSQELKGRGKEMTGDYSNLEYAKWMGTGLRFEKLRGKLAEGDEAAIASAKQIMERMVSLQPHRLYLVSERIRKRLHLNLNQEQIGTALFNLQRVESKIYAERERLLDAGKSFDTVSLDDFWSIIESETERASAQELARAVKGDFDNHWDDYKKEFITEREYTHGFVLWSGDAPVDEFNMTLLGDTGGYARRFRDNQAQAESVGGEIALLKSLKTIKTPAELIAGIMHISEKIEAYDAHKAKEAVYEKVVLMLKFLKEESFATQVPVAGVARRMFGKTSAAQLAYGKDAPSWGPTVIAGILRTLKDKDCITAQREKDAREILLAENKDILIESGNSLGQFGLLALLLLVITKSFENELK